MKDETHRSSRIARPGERLPSRLADTLKSPKVAVANCAASVSSNVDTVSIALRHRHERRACRRPHGRDALAHSRSGVGDPSLSAEPPEEPEPPQQGEAGRDRKGSCRIASDRLVGGSGFLAAFVSHSSAATHTRVPAARGLLPVGSVLARAGSRWASRDERATLGLSVRRRLPSGIESARTSSGLLARTGEGQLADVAAARS